MSISCHTWVVISSLYLTNLEELAVGRPEGDQGHLARVGVYLLHQQGQPRGPALPVLDLHLGHLPTTPPSPGVRTRPTRSAAARTPAAAPGCPSSTAGCNPQTSPGRPRSEECLVCWNGQTLSRAQLSSRHLISEASGGNCLRSTPSCHTSSATRRELGGCKV